MIHICFNGKMIPADEPVFLASNRGYRYGDGLFETMKVSNNTIRFADDHFERLFSGLSLLQFEVPALFTKEKIVQEILQLCRKNGSGELGRVRLSVFRGNGGLYDEDRKLQYLIESWTLSPSFNSLNENGLVIGVYPGARKTPDAFSALKSANFLIYSMAAIHVKENKWNDCLVLNTQGAIADTTIANLFLIKDNGISTPALTEGCVGGILRKNLLAWLRSAGYSVQEKTVTVADLENAEEVFLTNVINGIRWVGRMNEKIFAHAMTDEIYRGFTKTIPA